MPDPTLTAEFLQQYGFAGICGICFVVIVFLFNALQKQQEGRLHDTKESMMAVASAVKTIETALNALSRK